MVGAFLTIFICFFCRNTPVFGQTAEFVDDLLVSEAITVAESLFLVDILSGERPSVADFDATLWDGSSSQPIRTDDFVTLLARSTGIERSLMTTLTGLPRYALRDVRDARIIPPDVRRFPAGATLSGEDALRITQRAASIGSVGSSTDSLVDPLRPRSPGSFAHLEWDLLVDSSAESDLDGETQVSMRSTASFALVLGAKTQVDLDIGVDLGEDATYPIVSEAALTRFIDAEDNRSGTAGEIVLGRRPVLDLSTRLYDGPLDALSITLSRGDLAGELLLGYTGAIPAVDLDTVYTIADDTERNDRFVGPGDRAAGRYLGNLGILLPERFGRQTPFVQITTQIDEESLHGDTSADRFDALYGTVGVKGSLSRTQFYDAYGILSMSRYSAGDLGAADREGLGWLLGASWRWYPKDALRSRVAVELLTASGGDDEVDPLGFSGGDDERFRGFIPALGNAPWSAYDGLMTNVFVLRGSWSIRPAYPLLIELSLAGLTRLTDGATGSTGIDPDSSNRPLGIESGARIGIRPTRDVIFDINSSIFWPVGTDAGGSYLEERDNSGTVALNLTIQL